MTEDPRSALMRLTFGAMAATTVGAATRLGVPDALGEQARTADEVASACGAAPVPMLRFLRALTSLGICAEQPDGRYALSELGAVLRTDHPASAHAFVRMFTDPAMLAAWARLDDSVRTGDTSFDAVFGMPFFAHLDREPELSALFNASMSQATAAVAAELPGAYDFGRFGVVADIGGGDGTLLAAVLAAHPDLRGVVYDSPAGSAQATATLAAAGLAERSTVDTGDFFASVPGGADLYLLKSIIHDWDDDRAATILRLCRAELPEQGRVLVVEPILADQVSATTRPGLYLSDLNMLVNVGGRERTRDDFAELAAKAGLAITSVVPLAPEIGFALIECGPK